MSKADELKKLKELLDTGVLTKEEFLSEKEKLLNKKNLKNYSLIVLVFVLIFGYFLLPSSEFKDEESSVGEQNEYLVNTLEKAKKATLKVLTEGVIVEINDKYKSESKLVRGTGSGFFVHNGDYIVTNYHVVAGSKKISVYSDYFKKEVEAKIIGYSSCDDLAVLQLKEPFSIDKNYFFGFYEKELELGKEISSLGFPLGTNEITFSKGFVTKDRADGNTEWTSLDFAFEHDLGILPGSSGGPILDNNFNVVGVAYAGNNLNQKFGIEGRYSEKIVQDLIISKNINESFGLNVEQVPNVGVYINSVDENSIAESIGLKGGEIIVEFGDYDLQRDENLKTFCSVLRSSSKINSPYIKWIDIDKLTYYEAYLNEEYFTDNPLPINLPKYTTLEIETFVKNTSFYWDPVYKNDYIVTYSGYPSDYQLLKLQELVDQYNQISFIASYTLYKFGENPLPSSFHFVFSQDQDEISDFCKFQYKEWIEKYPDLKFKYDATGEFEEYTKDYFERECDFVNYKSTELLGMSIIDVETNYINSLGELEYNYIKYFYIATESEHAKQYPNRSLQDVSKCQARIQIAFTIRAFSGKFNVSKFIDSEELKDPKYESWFAEQYCNGPFSQSLSDFDLKIIQIDQDPRLLTYEVQFNEDGTLVNSMDDFVAEFKVLFGSDY